MEDRRRSSEAFGAGTHQVNVNGKFRLWKACTPAWSAGVLDLLQSLESWLPLCQTTVRGSRPSCLRTKPSTRSLCRSASRRWKTHLRRRLSVRMRRRASEGDRDFADVGVLGIWERSLGRSEEASRVSKTENQLVHLKGACG